MTNKTIIILFISILLGTLNASAQCSPNRHSTSWYDGWISCETSQNPNPERGVSHWILYDLGEPYALKNTHIWNSNDPAHLNFGIKDYYLDYSNDGINWNSLGAFFLKKANGSTVYEGEDGPDFQNIKARYVLVTAQNNYGGSCFGLSELKINVADPNSIFEQSADYEGFVFPNPINERFTLKVFTTQNQSQNIDYQITDISGRLISEGYKSDNGMHRYEFVVPDLKPGIYLLKVIINNQNLTYKLIKNQ